MKKTALLQGKSFLSAFLATTAAVVWSCMYTVSLWQILLIALIAVAAIFVPWTRFQTVARLLWVVASAASFGLGVKLMSRLNTDIPEWSWWLGWGVILVLLCYMGRRALYECAILPATVVAVALLLSFASSLPSFDGVIEWNGAPVAWTTGGAVVLVGCALTGLEIAPHKNAAKAGALCGIVVWALTVLIPLIMWSEQALGVISRALPRSLGRLDIISFMGCPDVLLCAMVAVAALWQCALGVTLLRSH